MSPAGESRLGRDLVVDWSPAALLYLYLGVSVTRAEVWLSNLHRVVLCLVCCVELTRFRLGFCSMYRHGGVTGIFGIQPFWQGRGGVKGVPSRSGRRVRRFDSRIGS